MRAKKEKLRNWVEKDCVKKSPESMIRGREGSSTKRCDGLVRTSGSEESKRTYTKGRPETRKKAIHAATVRRSQVSMNPSSLWFMISQRTILC